RDAFRCFPALKQYVAERLRQGELPQWFPYEALGREFIGQAAGGVFHFFSLLYLLLPAHEAYRLSVLLSCLAAALGAYALGRLLGYSRTGSLVAGLAFTCSGYLVSLTENIQYLYPLCALPLFCAALERGLTGNRKWLVATTLLWTSVFLHGDMQTGYYYGFAALAWTVWRAPEPKRGAFLRLATAIVLTALLSAVQLLPSAAVFVGSDRGDARGFEEQA